MEQLFIRLIASDADAIRAEWALYEDGERAAGSMADAPFSTLAIPAAGEQREVVLIVPGQQVLLTQVEVSPQQRRHLKKILPFLVEEQLADDITQMHFAAGPVEAGRRSQLEAWMGALARLQLKPHAVVPESWLVAAPAGRWQLLCDGERFWLSAGAEGKFTLEKALLPEFFSLLSQRQNTPALTVECSLFGAAQTDDTVKTLQQLEKRHPHIIFRVKSAEHLMEALCGSYVQDGAALNLLQGEFTGTAKPAMDMGTRRKLARVGAAWAAAMLVVTLLQSAYFTYQRSAAQREMAQLYQQLFPEDSRIVDPVAQMRARIGAPGDASGLLPMLQAVARGWSGAGQGVSMQSLRYDEAAKQLNLDVEAGTIEAVNALADGLQAPSLNAQVVSVVSENDTIRGQLMVREDAP